MLYGCEAWTLTQALETKIRSTQRKMLRMVVSGGHRRICGDNIEAWLDWLRRTTRTVEEHLVQIGQQDWVALTRQKQWRWARKVATMSPDRWAHKATQWTPQWSHNSRRQARPRTRWDDRINKYLQSRSATESWMEVAKTPQWLELEADYLKLSKR